MKYSYPISAPAAEVFEVLIAEQLSYYQRFLPKLRVLMNGTTIETKLPTKLNRMPLSAQLQVVEISSPTSFVQETKSKSGKITQSYRFEEKKGRTVLTYEEQNDFDQSIAKASYNITGLFYHFVFNRKAKKRACYLNDKARALVTN